MSPNPATKNPYRPGAAISPLFLAGRQKELARFPKTLDAAPELPANVRLTGLRGVGKTVLLKEYEKLAQDGHLNWIVSRIQIEPRHDREDDVTDLLVGHANTARLQASKSARLRENISGVVAAARGLVRVKFEDLELSLAPGIATHEQSIIKALFEAVEAADKNGYDGYVLMLDEAQVLRDDKNRGGEHPLSLVIAAINTLQEQQLPIAFVMCGLPTLRANLLKARTYTERMFRGEEITSLGGDAARDAFVRPLDDTGVVADDDLVSRVVAEVEGYPFFIQLWGAELWDAAMQAGVLRFSTALLDQVEADIYQRLDQDFYEPRVEALTPAEQDLLMATANCPYPPLKTADIHQRSGKKESNVNVLMGRLAEQGVVFRIQKGQYQYTAPKFHDFLIRRSERLARRQS